MIRLIFVLLLTVSASQALADKKVIQRGMAMWWNEAKAPRAPWRPHLLPHVYYHCQTPRTAWSEGCQKILLQLAGFAAHIQMVRELELAGCDLKRPKVEVTGPCGAIRRMPKREMDKIQRQWTQQRPQAR